MFRGAWMPMRTFSPMMARTEISISSPIMMLWLDFRVRTSIGQASLPGWVTEQSNQGALTTTSETMPYGSDVHQFGADSQGNALVSAPPMARRSLRPHLNQIRGWVRQGRTDAWIAHQLEVTVQQIQSFKRENELAPDSDSDAEVTTGVDFDDEV